jgi:hypothetical protein
MGKAKLKTPDVETLIAEIQRRTSLADVAYVKAKECDVFGIASFDSTIRVNDLAEWVIDDAGLFTRIIYLFQEGADLSTCSDEFVFNVHFDSNGSIDDIFLLDVETGHEVGTWPEKRALRCKVMTQSFGGINDQNEDTFVQLDANQNLSESPRC